MLSFLLLMDPFLPLMIRRECCNLPPVQRSLCHLVGFPLLSLIDLTLQVLLCPMAELS